jgi:hypothetical protein
MCWSCGKQFGGGAGTGGRLDRDVTVLLEEGTGFPGDACDGRPADVTEGLGEDVQGAHSPQVEDGEQHAFAVADLLREDATASTRLGWATAPLVAEAFGLSRLPCGKSLGESVQLVAGQSGQGRMGELFDDGGARGAQIAVQEGE